MGAFVVSPLPFTVLASSAQTTAPATNLATEHPARVWRSLATTSTIIDIQGAGQTIDTLALVGSNLLASDSVTVRFADAQADLAAATPVTVPAFVGQKAPTISTKTIMRFAPRAYNFVRITITSPVAKMIEAQRLVIGSAVTCSGLDYGAKLGSDDNSLAIEGINYTAYRRYARKPKWVCTITIDNDDAWYDVWFPFLNDVGTSGQLLFVPDDENMRQNGLLFGKIVSRAEGEAEGYNYWKVSLSVTADAP